MEDKQNKENYRYQEQKQEQQDTQKGGSGGYQFHFSFDNDTHYDDFMRRPRSQAYLEAMQIVDMLSSTDEDIIEKLQGIVDEDTLEEFKEMTPEEILEELRLSFEEEFAAAELEFKDLPVPPRPELVICKCYIDGCDVHAIDGFGMIKQHYKIRADYGDDVIRGRKVYYSHPGCTCVEVYSNCCRVVMPDGSVEKVDNKNI